ncbi:MAG: Gfo/Idh/MocA family oxidoreductase [Planctomycetota bacterium]
MTETVTDPKNTSTGFNRRQFMKSSAIMAPAVLAIGPRAFASDDSTLKFGLIGCGGRGTGAANQALRADKNNVLWAVADAFEDRIGGAMGLLRAEGEKLKAKHNSNQIQVTPERQFSGFDAYQKLIDSGVDVVLLATPPYFRPEQLRAAIDAGKHVFSEKPMAVDGPGVRSVMESAKIAKEKNLSLVAGFCWRFKENDRQFVKRLHDGIIGDIRAVYTDYLTGILNTHPRKEGWTDMEFQLRNWQHFNWLSGDHIAEQAVHSIDKINWFMNDVAPVKAISVGGRQSRADVPRTGDVFDHFGVIFEYADGARGFHLARQSANCFGRNTDYIMGSKGIADVNSWGPKHVVTGENNWTGKRRHMNGMYQQEHDELFAAIRKGEPINDGAWMAQSTLMAIMARMSAYTGKDVSFEAALNSKEVLGPKVVALNGEAPRIATAIPGQTKFA